MVNYRPPVAPLFVPANRPKRIAKAATSGADAIIVDLEDAVPPHQKDTARDGLVDEIGGVAIPVFLRINGRGTPWFEPDLGLAALGGFAGIMLPKSECAGDLKAVAARVGSSMPVIALIESAAGIADLHTLKQAENLAQFAFGSIDYALDLNCHETREAMLTARSHIVLQSRLARRPAPIDGVTKDISDEEILTDDSRYAVSLGFGGKLAIHPKQVSVIRSAFRPSDAEIAWSKEILAAEAASDGAAVQLTGQMVDRPVIERARQILVSLSA